MQIKTVILVLFCLYLLSSCSGDKSNMPVAQKGVIDLSSWSFDNDGIVELKGEWEFYPEQLLDNRFFEKQPPSKTQYIDVPKNWSDLKSKIQNNKNIGFATYRIKVLTGKKNLDLKLNTFEISTAAKVFINNKQLAAIGTVAKNKEQAVPQRHYNLPAFHTDKSTFDIIIQASNYSLERSGLSFKVHVGATPDIDRKELYDTIINSFIIGICLFMAFYHIVLFLYRRKTKVILFLALFALANTIYFFMVSSKLVYFFFPEIYFKLVILISRLGSISLLYFGFAYIYNLYLEEGNAKIKKAIELSLLILFFAVIIDSRAFVLVRYIAFATTLYLIYFVGKAVKKRKKGAFIVALGILVYLITGLNDVLVYMNLCDTILLTHWGQLFFFVSQSFFLARIFSHSLDEAERLGEELKKTNQNLEMIVEERTYIINLQKEEILQQSENINQAYEKLLALSKYKEEMASMIVHDLKNPLNAIINISKNPLDRETIKTVRRYGKQMLNMVLNILDVSKYKDVAPIVNMSESIVSDVVKSAISQVLFLSDQKNIEIVNEVSEEFTAQIDIDIIERVFVNLLTNAIKYSYPDSQIFIQCHEHNDEYLMIKVIDNGEGIPEEKKHLVFSKYEQFAQKKSGSISSTGIGLSFCEIAVKAHNGTIDFEDNEDAGTVFWFTLKKGKQRYTEHTTEKKEHNYYGTLSTLEKEVLSVVIKQLRVIEIYKITEIEEAISSLKDIKNKNIGAWIDELMRCVNNFDIIGYNRLIE